MKIIGAGFAGLLAACHFPSAEIYEAGPEDQINHKALLRFRAPDIGNQLGIEFKPVAVHKSIWSEGKHRPADIRLANLYSQKLTGAVTDRSIWNLDTCERWIAPENFFEQLIDRCGDRIKWNEKVEPRTAVFDEPIISTIPLEFTSSIVTDSKPKFNHSSVSVKRYRINNTDVHQTIYFPDLDTSLYRASIVGDLLIEEHYIDCDNELNMVLEAFGLARVDPILIDEGRQRYGKILPIPDDWRKKVILDLTMKHNIYSLGRFATWRNILLDDVLKDIFVLKKLMKTSGYEKSKYFSK